MIYQPRVTPPSKHCFRQDSKVTVVEVLWLQNLGLFEIIFTGFLNIKC